MSARLWIGIFLKGKNWMFRFFGSYCNIWFFLLRYQNKNVFSKASIVASDYQYTTIDFYLALQILSPAFAVLYITKCSSGKCIDKCQMMQSFSSFSNCAITFSRFTLSGFNLSIIFSNSSLTSERWLDDSEKRLAEGKIIHPSNDVVKSIHNKIIALL